VTAFARTDSRLRKATLGRRPTGPAAPHAPGDAAQADGNAHVDRHLPKDLDDLSSGDADIARSADADLQLSGRGADGGQGGDGQRFAPAQVEARSGDDFGEVGAPDDLTQIRRQRAQGVVEARRDAGL
jgi:hypothetical protein